MHVAAAAAAAASAAAILVSVSVACRACLTTLAGSALGHHDRGQGVLVLGKETSLRSRRRRRRRRRRSTRPGRVYARGALLAGLFAAALEGAGPKAECGPGQPPALVARDRRHLLLWRCLFGRLLARHSARRRVYRHGDVWDSRGSAVCLVICLGFLLIFLLISLLIFLLISLLISLLIYLLCLAGSF